MKKYKFSKKEQVRMVTVEASAIKYIKNPNKEILRYLASLKG